MGHESEGFGGTTENPLHLELQSGSRLSSFFSQELARDNHSFEILDVIRFAIQKIAEVKKLLRKKSHGGMAVVECILFFLNLKLLCQVSLANRMKQAIESHFKICRSSDLSVKTINRTFWICISVSKAYFTKCHWPLSDSWRLWSYSVLLYVPLLDWREKKSVLRPVALSEMYTSAGKGCTSM